MITLEEAIQKIRETPGEDMDVMPDDIVERDYGWVLFPQSKEYIETKDPMMQEIGAGGVLVEKATGRKYEFGSAYTTDENLHIYELGYLQYDDWDIEIINVRDESSTIDHLSCLGLTYIVPEEEYGAVWKIPKAYEKEQLKQQIISLPARFNLGSIYFKWEVLESFKNQSDFEYRMSGNNGHVNGI